jgi:hypothetical protein
MNIALDTVQQRVAGEQPSRTRSFLTAMALGVAAAVVTYRLLRRENEADGENERDEE